MLAIERIREHTEEVVSNLAKRNISAEQVNSVRELDARWRKIQTELDELRAEQNAANTAIAAARGEEKEQAIRAMQRVAEKITKLRRRLTAAEAERLATWRMLPNEPREDVPEGGENDFEVVRAVPEKVTEKDFELKDYFELGEGTLFNLKEASRVSGSRFVYITGQLARLQMALVSWIFDELARDSFVPVIPPVLVGEQAMSGMGYLDHEGDEVYRTQDDLYLVGTSEQALGPIHTRKRIPASQLPKRYVGYSSCFRREAGSHGKDVRGLLRLHQFDKVEMFSFAHPAASDREHEFLLARQEALMQALELPYRVVKVAAGDLGTPSARTYDIETWLPSEQRYRETHSTSTTTDYQARRLNIRFEDENGKQYVHMLNGTALAMSRIFIALLENHQQADGSVTLPAVLHSYLPFQKIEAK